jgi:hypothetical protein
MKLFQCIHKYPRHIPQFEEKYKIKEKGYGFEDVVNLLLKDGYAATYILDPASDTHTAHQFFFTLWDYDHLQHLWADENGLKTRDLDKIKLTQIEAFQPDVFYNLSARYDNNFVNHLAGKKNLKKVCWDGVIKNYPLLHPKYDARLTLFQPYVDYWNSKGLFSAILPPSYVPSWIFYNHKERPIDVLFYGQYLEGYFSKRNQIIEGLLRWSEKRNYNIQVHLQYKEKKKPYIDKRFIRSFTKWKKFPPKIIREKAKPPIYGYKLYEAIGRSKIVINCFTDHNGLYKDNMRIYEAIGCGALMISEDGIYPNGLKPGEDFLTFHNTKELLEKIDYALNLPDQGRSMAEKAHKKLKKVFSKSAQWTKFEQIVEKL